MSKRVQAECEDKTCQFCTGKHCKILNQKLEGECTFKKQRKSSAERQREEYHWAKENHLCVQCHKQDAYTLSGRVHCFECTQKDKEYRQKSYWKDPEKDKIRKQKKHDESEQQGVCVRCHKRKPIDGLKMCPTCLAKNRKKYRIWAEKNGITPRGDLDYNDLCYMCHKEKKMKNRKMCKSCYEKICENLKKGREIARANKTNEQFLYCFHFGRGLYGNSYKSRT